MSHNFWFVPAIAFLLCSCGSGVVTPSATPAPITGHTPTFAIYLPSTRTPVPVVASATPGTPTMVSNRTDNASVPITALPTIGGTPVSALPPTPIACAPAPGMSALRVTSYIGGDTEVTLHIDVADSEQINPGNPSTVRCIFIRPGNHSWIGELHGSGSDRGEFQVEEGQPFDLVLCLDSDRQLTHTCQGSTPTPTIEIGK